MPIQDRERLRQLVGDYYHGLITLESYRAQRGELLDNIGAVIDEGPDTATARREAAMAKDRPTGEPETPEVAIRAPETGSRKGVFVAIAAVVVIGVAVVLATQMTGSETEPRSEQAEAVPRSGLERGDALIEEFLERNDWSADTLNNFELAWAALDDGQRQLALDGRRYRRLSTRLHQRIREEVALGTAPTSVRMRSLVDFASTMGVPYTGSLALTSSESPQAQDTVVEQDAEFVTYSAEDDVVAPATEDPAPESIAIETESPPATDQQAARDTPPVDAPAAEPVETAVAEPITGSGAERVATRDDPCPASIANTRRPYCQDALPNGGKGPALVVLPSGSFDMGDDGKDSESPMHRVSIGRSIAMSRFEVTANEYGAFCAATSLPCPATPWSGDHPVVSISWDDAVQYTDWLSETTGFRYRLPSEAEWEYAARAGTQTSYYFGDEITPSAALSSVNGPVEQPLPRTDRTINRNPFRLYHMSGNVREWTLDAWYPDYQDAATDGTARTSDAQSSRVVRGGSFSDPGDRLRSAAREALDRSHRDTETGFRVVREVVAARD